MKKKVQKKRIFLGKDTYGKTIYSPLDPYLKKFIEDMEALRKKNRTLDEILGLK